MTLMKFEQHKCNPCEAMQAYLETTGVPVTRINVEEHPDMAVEWKIRAAPTLIMLDAEGREVKRISGYSRSAVVEMVKEVRGGGGEINV